MATLSTTGFAHALSAASSVPDALRALRAQLDDAGKGLQLSYYVFDSRRQIVTERYRALDGEVVAQPFQVSLDHLPTKFRRDLLAGAALVDFGEQSSDFLRFFGIEDHADAYLLVQGIRAHGELCGLVAVREPRQRFGSRAVERIAAPVAVFALGVTLTAERAARKQAEESLEQILAKVHEEHAQAMAAMQRELDALRRQLTAGGVDARVAELQRVAQEASERARGATERLQAVEQQVANAVAQLEKAHVDLSRQSEALRTQGGVLHRVQKVLGETSAGRDPRTQVEEALAVLSAAR